MRTSGSCDNRLLSEIKQEKNISDAMPIGGDKAGKENLQEVAEKFASVFYEMLFASMEKTVQREDEGVMEKGATGMVQRYLPQQLAGDSDPITRYVYDSLKQESGGKIDEQA